MTQFLQNLLTASFHGSIVILAVILLRLVLRKTPKKYICLLWLLAGIRLLMPIEIRSELSLQPELPLVIPEALNTVLLPLVWGMVACCFGIYSFVSYRKLKTKVREAVRIRGGWECDKIDTAFILGFIKPRIYIPMGMNVQSRKHILEHERTHLDKGDHWIKMIGFLALALHWFNPLVWVAYVLLCKDIEMACDERVVQFMELEERKSYSAALLSCSTKQLHFSANPVAFGEVSVKERILSVLNYKKPSFWISMLGVVAFFFVAVCLVTSPPYEAEPVIVEVPADEYVENTPEEISNTTDRVEKAWDRILSGEKYHLYFADATYDGSVGWQVNVYKNGTDTLWYATDHMTEEGHMVLEGVHYKYIDGSSCGWVPYEEEDALLTSLLGEFALEGKSITDIVSQTKTNDAGYSYEELTFNTHFKDEKGNKVTQPMKLYFDPDGNLTGMRVENSGRKGADMFTFSNWSDELSEINSMETVFRNAGENILAIEDVDPDKLQPPTQDELNMKEWGVQYRVDDDLLTQYGSEVWFCQAEGYNMTVHTNNEYWIEKKTESGWEKLEMLAEPEWAPANYTLGHGMYTMTFVDWSELYGPLPGGTYRMGKTFEKMGDGTRTCIGYAEFVIYHNDASTAEQTAAVEKCYAGVEILKNRQTLHYKVTNSQDDIEEIWWNNGDFLVERQWVRDIYPDTTNGQELKPEDIIHEVNQGISARKDGVGYSCVFENQAEHKGDITGMELSTLSADFAGWELYSFAENLSLYAFERGNEINDFSSNDCCITDEKISFHQYWSDPNEYTSVTFWFDESGNITKMESVTHYKDINGFTITFEIYNDTAEEIDAKIKPYTENLIVEKFSWREAKAKYTDEEFNIREDSFINTEVNPIQSPVDAARLALKEYPNLGDYLSLDVLRDEDAGMWKVTIENYVDYQATYGYRDVYIADNGVTCLLVYEGPIGWEETRK